MDNFIQEIEEDLRRDRYKAQWEKYGRFAVAAALVTVIAVAGVLFWRQYQAHQRQADGLAYVTAIDMIAGEGTSPAEATDAALPTLRQLARQGTAGYAALARLQEAQVLLRAGQGEEAVAAYQALANDGSADRLFRDLAILLLALHQADSADPQSLLARLQPLTAAGNPWRHSALEVSALAAQRAGDADRAKEIYARLADDPAAPRQLRARAAELLAALGG